VNHEKELTMIQTVHLFPILDEKLLQVLRSLNPEDWEKKTISPKWTIKDIAAHLLDGNIRSLSMLRDGYYGEKPENVNSYADLLDFLNGLNTDWVKAMRRVSPRLLVDLLEMTGKAYCTHIASLPPFEPAAFSVAWAGENVSLNWFHVAREYTEKWHHQQQIRLAVDLESELFQAELYRPYLETSMLALPHHYRKMEAEDNTLIKIQVRGEGGGDWWLIRKTDTWELVIPPDKMPDATVSIPGEIAWRIFTKGITKEEAKLLVVISGEKHLGEHILSMLAVMA
jgi:hypothetical protein